MGKQEAWMELEERKEYEMTQSVKCLPCKLEDVGSVPRTPIKKLAG